MSGKFETSLPKLIQEHEAEILKDWIREQQKAASRRTDLQNQSQLEKDSKEFLRAFRNGVVSGVLDDVRAPAWAAVRELLSGLSRNRALTGYSPTETATFVFSLKQILFERMMNTFRSDGETLARELWTVTEVLDGLGLYTTEVFQKSREEVISRQQEEMLELSTPVVKLWEGILALPMIGTLDSARTQVVMESLLRRIVETGSEIAIIDITGVPQVDTLVAQHLLKTVTAARLMGAECIVSGIRPQIAQTIVHLGVDLGNITTKATLADAFLIALSRTGRAVRPYAAAPSMAPQYAPMQASPGLTTQPFTAAGAGQQKRA